MTQDTEDVVDLIAQLRTSAECESAEFGYPPYQSNCWQAADLIQSLSDRIDVLEGAVAPFAGHANIVDAEGLADMDEPDFDGWSLLAGDFRRARAALHQEAT